MTMTAVARTQQVIHVPQLRISWTEPIRVFHSYKRSTRKLVTPTWYRATNQLASHSTIQQERESYLLTKLSVLCITEKRTTGLARHFPGGINQVTNSLRAYGGI
jgi:hypothetical protein